MELQSTEESAEFNIANVSDADKDLLLWSHVQQGNISQEIFEQNYTLLRSNPDYRGMLTKMSANPGTAFLMQAMLAAGPAAFLAVVGDLVNAGIVDKKQVREATGIKKAPRTTKSWHKLIAEDIFPSAHATLVAKYAEGVEGWKTRFPTDTVPPTFEEYLKATGKASISSTVDNYDHPQSKKSCALALVLRVDYNCAARNGTKTEDKETPDNGA